MRKLHTKYGTSQYAYKDYIIAETHAYGRRLWITDIFGSTVLFETLKEAREWINKRLELFKD